MSLETHRINSTCFLKLLAAGRLIAGAGVVDALVMLKALRPCGEK